MKIFTSEQIQKIDQYTIDQEPILSIDLMERASRVFTDWLIQFYPPSDIEIAVFVGPGNNGGDGLAVARMLQNKGYPVTVFQCQIGNKKSQDYQINFERLPISKGLKVQDLIKGAELPDLRKFDLIIDGIFGSGLNRPVEGYWAELFQHVNLSGKIIFSIDIPSGLFADKKSTGSVICADKVLSFEFPKLSFLFPDNQTYVKNWEARSIGLSNEIIEAEKTKNYYIDKEFIQKILKPRLKFQHKGNFGHALIAGGSWGKIGAIALAAKACLRSGVGLVTCYIPGCGYEIIQSTVSEAMVITDTTNTYLSVFKSDINFDTAGIGCGMGKGSGVKSFLASILSQFNVPLVLDADALNNISEDNELMSSIPEGSILTPHLKEFSRLFGVGHDDFERHALQKEMSKRYQCIIVLKGAHTCITTPQGISYFNSTGNPGMATAGSGDVLTGIITAFLAQNYTPEDAAILGVYVHGLAGDFAAYKLSEHSLIASDIIQFIPAAFNDIQKK